MQQFAVVLLAIPGARMLAKVREILLTQYIGAILVALILWQAGFEVIKLAVRSAFWLFARQRVSILEAARRPAYDWNATIFSCVTIALYLLIAYGLARWLYPTRASNSQPESDGGQPDGPNNE